MAEAERVVNIKEIKMMVEQLGIPYVETTSKDGLGVEEVWCNCSSVSGVEPETCILQCQLTQRYHPYNFESEQTIPASQQKALTSASKNTNFIFQVFTRLASGVVTTRLTNPNA